MLSVASHQRYGRERLQRLLLSRNDVRYGQGNSRALFRTRTDPEMHPAPIDQTPPTLEEQSFALGR